MAQLHELLAVMADTTNSASAIIKETQDTFTKRDSHFQGQTRAVTYLADERQGENVTDNKELVTTVGAKLDHLGDILGNHYDALLQQEEANTRAKADLVVNGTTLMENVPATFLLGMESRLKSLRTVLLAAPTLEPAMKWDKDEGTGEGVYRAEANTQMKTEKTLRYKVLVEPTDRHPAQVEKWNEDVPVARIETTHRSGKLSPAEKSAMVRRLDTLITAVKKARQRANCVEVNDLKIADTLFTFITQG